MAALRCAEVVCTRASHRRARPPSPMATSISWPSEIAPDSGPLPKRAPVSAHLTLDSSHQEPRQHHRKPPRYSWPPKTTNSTASTVNPHSWPSNSAATERGSGLSAAPYCPATRSTLAPLSPSCSYASHSHVPSCGHGDTPVHARRRLGKCPFCLYDLQGTAGPICPECGRNHGLKRASPSAPTPPPNP